MYATSFRPDLEPTASDSASASSAGLTAWSPVPAGTDLVKELLRDAPEKSIKDLSSAVRIAGSFSDKPPRIWNSEGGTLAKFASFPSADERQTMQNQDRTNLQSQFPQVSGQAELLPSLRGAQISPVAADTSKHYTESLPLSTLEKANQQASNSPLLPANSDWTPEFASEVWPQNLSQSRTASSAAKPTEKKARFASILRKETPRAGD